MSFWKSDSVSIDAYLLERQSHQISFLSDLKRWSLRLFWTGRPKKNKNNNKENNKMSSDMRPVPDPPWLGHHNECNACRHAEQSSVINYHQFLTSTSASRHATQSSRSITTTASVSLPGQHSFTTAQSSLVQAGRIDNKIHVRSAALAVNELIVWCCLQ